MLTQQIFSAGEEKNLWKKIEKYCTFGHYHEDYPSSTGQKGVPPPYEKKFFSADLDELGHEKIKIKKLRKWEKFVLTPPPC